MRSYSAGTSRPRLRLTAIFRIPAVITFFTILGLVTALLGDGIWDDLSCVALSVPIAVAVWFACLRRTN
jgi:hypothetical protein